MNFLFHLYRYSQNNFFFENRFAYVGEANPSPDINEQVQLVEAVKPLARDLGKLTDQTHHFDDAKIKALNLLADVDKVVPTGDPLRPQAEKLKNELANHSTEGIHAKFDALHAEYDVKLNDAVNGIAALGPTHPEAERIRSDFRARAEALIAEVKARVAEPEVKDYVTHHAGMEALTAAAGATPEARIAARTKVLESMFTALQIPENVRGIARAMAEVMEDLKITITPGSSVAQVRKWFKEQLENTTLIAKAMEELTANTPRFEATGAEITMFTGLLNKKPDGTATNVNSERLGFTFGLPNMPQAAEALARRFHTVTTRTGTDQLTYYVDLKDPKKTVYTEETLKKALPGIVEKEMSTGEAVGAQLAAMREHDSQLQIALAEVADVNQHWYNPASWNDMIDRPEELRGEEDAAKLEHLAILLRQANGVQDSVATFDKAERGKIVAERERVAVAQKEADKFQANVGEYATARTGLVGITLAENAQFVPPTKDFKDAKPGDIDKIEIKNKAGDKVLARIETKLEALHKPRLSVLGADGKEVFGKSFDSVADLQTYLATHTDVTKITPELVKANKARVEAVREALWGKGKKEQLVLGRSGLSMQASAAVFERIGPDEPLVVTIKLFNKDKSEAGYIQVDFPASGDPTAQIVILGKGVASNLKLEDVRKNLEDSGERYLKEAKAEVELAEKNKTEVEKVFAAIILPPGSPPWAWGAETAPASFTDPAAVATRELKNPLGQLVVTVQVNVATRQITLTPAGGKLGTNPISLEPDKVQQFLTDNVLKLQPAPATTVVAAPGAAPERAPLRTDLEAARPKLIAVLQGQYPRLFGGDAINKPETEKAIDGILTNLTPARIALLTERGANFVPSPSEGAMIIAEVQKANGWAEVGALDSAEVALIDSLPHTTDTSQTFATVFGANSSVAQALSRQYSIRQNTGTGGGIIINNGEKDTVVIRMESLAAFLPEADRKTFEAALDMGEDKKAARDAAIAALRTSADARGTEMETIQQVSAALRSENAKEVFGKMGIGELIASITQIWKAIQEGMKTGDFTVANDVLSLLNKKRNPAEIMNKNQRHFANILRDTQPKDIGQLLGAYLSPKGSEANEVFGDAAAAKAGITDATDLADLKFFRTEMKPAIAKYLTNQFGLTKIESIAGADSGTIVTGFKSGQKYEIEFSTNASGQFCAKIFKFHDKPAEGDTKAIKQGERDETAVGATAESDGAIAAVDFAKIQEVITGKKPPETRGAAAPETPPPRAPETSTAQSLGWGDVKGLEREIARAAIVAKGGKALEKQYLADAKKDNPPQDKIAAWRLKWLIDHQVPKTA